MKNHFLYFVGLSFVMILLFILHSAFAFALLPIFLANDFFAKLFVFFAIDFKIVIPYIFGAVFAIAIGAIMRYLNRKDEYFWKFVYSIAALELSGVALLCFPSHDLVWLAISGLYYGVYLFILIVFYFYIKPDETSIIAQELQTIAPKLQDAIASNDYIIADNKPTYNDYSILRDKGLSNDDVSKQLQLRADQKHRFNNRYGKQLK